MEWLARRLCWLIFLLPWTLDFAAAQAPGPRLAGLQGDHPLSQRALGEVLLSELQCASCHADVGPPPAGIPASKRAPDLAKAGARIAPTYLKKWILNPADVQPGTTMPNVLSAVEADARDAAAEALTHFLVSIAEDGFRSEPIDADEASSGAALYRQVGCIACHGVGTQLAHVRDKYALAPLAEFLFQPLHIRPSGRMPDMRLTRKEAVALASYLLADQAESQPALTIQPHLAKRGRELYLELGCAACHPLGALAAPAKIAEPTEVDQGCLSGAPQGAPDYGLSDAQRSALRDALQPEPSRRTDADRIAQTLTMLNCIACHQRGDYGGVAEEHNEFFETTEHDLGEEARIPPPLTGVGSKLQDEALRRMLFDADAVRPYMLTRMPQYGPENLAHLPELFARVDNDVDPYPLAKLEGEAAKTAREAGKTLLGIRGVTCISCHTFNGKKGPGFQGIDLLTFPERLQSDWFAQFVIDPQRFRPGIVMPESWSGGIAAHDGILEGNTQAQIEAIWNFLGLGTSARDPDGIRREPTNLLVTDQPLTYRGRSQIAGFRGIAVGFPGGLNYAFNANTGTLSALWRGEFLSVRWDGQGAGDFHPRAKPVQLAQDVSFFALQDRTSPWPLRPVMTEEEPVNPDPLYPKNRGYQFQGYALDGQGVPTLRYRSGSISIEDRSEPDATENPTALVRHLTFLSPTAQALTFRALAGPLEPGPTKGLYRLPELQLQVEHADAQTRPLTGDEPAQELLLHLQLSEGTTTLTLRYELLR